MLFRIAKGNQERAARAFTVEREKYNFGYLKSGILKPKSNCIMHYYEIDMIDADRIVCTVRHKNTDCIVALVWLSGYTPESIEVDQAELYRNCSNYPYRREYNEKYLKKYDQIACIVHGAIAAGLLFDTVEAPTTEETSEAAQDTACTDKEPHRATETAQKTTEETASYIARAWHNGEIIAEETIQAPNYERARAVARFLLSAGLYITVERATETEGTRHAGETAHTTANYTSTPTQRDTSGETTPHGKYSAAVLRSPMIRGRVGALSRYGSIVSRSDVPLVVSAGMERHTPRHAFKIAPGRTEPAQPYTTIPPRNKTPPRDCYSFARFPPRFQGVKIRKKTGRDSGAVYGGKTGLAPSGGIYGTPGEVRKKSASRLPEKFQSGGKQNGKIRYTYINRF